MKFLRYITITDAILDSSTVSEDEYGAYNSGTTYAIGDRCIVTTPDIHRVYESLKGSNINHNPPDNTTGADPYWLEVSLTNRWAMFDGTVETQTENDESIVVAITPAERINSIVLLNVNAESVTVVMNDPIDGEVYNSTIAMPSTETADRVKTDLPPYKNATITVTISNAGSTAKCGCLFIGMHRNFGNTLRDPAPEMGIIDYSIKQADAFGVYYVLQRSYSRKVTAKCSVPLYLHSEVKRLLAEYRATPAVYIVSESDPVIVIYGFYKDFDINLDNYTYAILSIELEGLI